MDPDQGKSTLRQPFITTANALANLYKTAAAAEKEARDGGARAAYMHVMQWAARKSRRNEPFSTAEVIALCGTELAKIPPSSSSSREEEGSGSPAAPRALGTSQCPNNQDTRQRLSQRNVSNSENLSMRDDPLVSDIRKLDVNPNPRKRPRTAISETFIRACQDSGNGNLFSMGSHGLQGGFGDFSAVRTHRDSSDDMESRDTRTQTSTGRGTAEPRKTRTGRLNIIEKQRRK